MKNETRTHALTLFATLLLAPLPPLLGVEPISPAAGAVVYSPHPHFRWQREADVKIDEVHRIQIARDEAFKTVVAVVKDLRMPLQGFQIGWEVVQISAQIVRIGVEVIRISAAGVQIGAEVIRIEPEIVQIEAQVMRISAAVV